VFERDLRHFYDGVLGGAEHLKYFEPMGKKSRGAASEPRQQYAALPWRMGDGVEILLASSRDTRRWVIPKGWPMKGREPHIAAAIEAQQEAGLTGKIEKTKIGSFHYQKRMKNGAAILCRVDVFPMRVLRQAKHWPEQGQRVTQWFTYADAAEEVSESELRALILAFGEGKLLPGKA
jgi:8-oxo-dGTP pyrophosphatase MutT (NUDIX family)